MTLDSCHMLTLGSWESETLHTRPSELTPAGRVLAVNPQPAHSLAPSPFGWCVLLPSTPTHGCLGALGGVGRSYTVLSPGLGMS